MKRSDIYLAAIWITFFPRIVGPLLLIALLGMLARCGEHCPTDPLTHSKICIEWADRDPAAWERAEAAEAGIYHGPTDVNQLPNQ